MGNILFYVLIFITFVQFSFGAVRFSGVNRTFMGLYRGVFETALITVDSSGEEIYPYFKEDILEKNIREYFSDNITRYVKHYKTAIYYFDPDDGSICSSHHCYAVKVSLEADINIFFHYKKANEYVVRD